MIIDNELLNQLSETSKLDLESSDNTNNQADFLHKLESIVQLFKMLDETDDLDSELNPLHAHLREDVIDYENLIDYLQDNKQFNSDKKMFEVPKVIESE